MATDLAVVVNNALKSFCDKTLEDETKVNEEEGWVVTRKVRWQYGDYEFRATLITLAGEASMATFDYRALKESNWHKLGTARSFAEKLTEAREQKTSS